jgi:hypothetical protein
MYKNLEKNIKEKKHSSSFSFDTLDLQEIASDRLQTLL